MAVAAGKREARIELSHGVGQMVDTSRLQLVFGQEIEPLECKISPGYKEGSGGDTRENSSYDMSTAL